MAKKEMKYYLRKSAFGLASVFCTLLVGTASVSAQVTMRGQKYATKAEATARLTTLKQQHPELASTIAGFESKINDSNLIQVDDINKILAEAEQTIAVKAEAERSNVPKKKQLMKLFVKRRVQLSTFSVASKV